MINVPYFLLFAFFVLAQNLNADVGDRDPVNDKVIKSNDLILEGGGHKMAVGLKIDKNKLEKINQFLIQKFDLVSKPYV